MDELDQNDIRLVGHHLAPQDIEVLTERRSVHAEPQHFRIDPPLLQSALDHVGERIARIEIARMHVAVADHRHAQPPGHTLLGIVGLGGIPAVGIDSDPRRTPVGMTKDGNAARLVTHDAVDRHVGKDVIGLQKDAEDNELEERQHHGKRPRRQRRIA